MSKFVRERGAPSLRASFVGELGDLSLIGGDDAQVENNQEPDRATLPPWVRLPRNGARPRKWETEALPEVRWRQEGASRGHRARGGAAVRGLMAGVAEEEIPAEPGELN